MPGHSLRTVKFFDPAPGAPKIVDECSALPGIRIQSCSFNLPNVHELEPLRVCLREINPELGEL